MNSASTVTLFQTITATPKVSSSGISTKNKNIAIGVGVGIGVPVIVVIIITLLFVYRRKKLNSVRNYVDSNGKDVGIAVEEGNPIKKSLRRFFLGFPTLNNNPDDGDFDDDIPEDLINEPKPNIGLNSNTGTTYKNNNSINQGFVVNRPKPLHLVNNDESSNNDSDSQSETQSPFTIPKSENTTTNNTVDDIPNLPDTDDSDDISTDDYVMAPDSSSPDNNRGTFPHLDL